MFQVSVCIMGNFSCTSNRLKYYVCALYFYLFISKISEM